MQFSKKEIIIQAWDMLKQHISLFMLIVVFIFGLNVLLGTIQERLLVDITYQSIIFSCSAYLFQLGINLGVLNISLNIMRDREVSFSLIFNNFHLLFMYIITLIYFLIILIIIILPGLIVFYVTSSDSLQFTNIIGIILMFFPAVYASIRLQFYDYLLIDEGCSPLNALKKSYFLTKGYTMELFLLGAIMSIIVLLSIIPLGLGLLISVPLYIMVNACVYYKLKKSLNFN